ncbi:hypothetical protein MZH80_17935 [Escherichia coli]|nr:hypothetical protein [Escherichia coli]MCK3539255.1 hypothetical protein [Escherichia coli]
MDAYIIAGLIGISVYLVGFIAVALINAKIKRCGEGKMIDPLVILSLCVAVWLAIMIFIES